MRPSLYPIIIGSTLLWVPRADGVRSAIYTDLASGRYWANRRQMPDFETWRAALSGTFTRASTKMVTNSSRLLASVAVNTLGFDYDPATAASKGALSEGARTNIVLRSQEIDDAAWTKLNITISADTIAAPDGTTTADKLVETTASGVHKAFQLKAAQGIATYTWSVFAKAGERNWVFVDTADDLDGDIYTYFDLTNGVVGTVGAGVTASMIAYPNGWYRLICTRTSAHVSVYHQTGPATADATNSYAGDDTKGAYFWGAQLEQAAPFASSYIPTTTTSVTRAADSLTRTRTNPTTISKLLAGRTPAGVATEHIIWSADDGTANDRLRVTYKSDGKLHVVVADGGVDQADLDMGAVAVNTAFKLAFRAGANDFAASLNGGAVVTDVSGTMPTGLTTDRLGAGLTAGQEWFSTISQDAEWFNLAASNAELVKLST